MKKGIRILLPGALFFLVNFSVTSIELYFVKAFFYFGLLILIYFILREYDLSKILKPIIIGISSILFSYGLFQKFYIFPKILNSFVKKEEFFSQALFERVNSGRVFSLFTLPTLYGIICAVLIISLFHYLRGDFLTYRKQIFNIIFLFFFLCIGIFNLILTQSFGAIIYLSIGLFIYLLIERKIDAKYISLIIMTMFLVIFIVVGLRYKEAKNLEPVKLRLTNWNQALRMISNNPLFGVGLGNYGAKVSYYTRQGEARSLYTHNFFLQLSAETGIIFITFLILLAFINRRKLMPDFKDKSLYVSVLIMLLVYNLIDIGLYFFSAGIIFSIVLSQIYQKKTGKVRMKILFLFMFSLIYGIAFLSDDYLSEANILLSRNDKAGASYFYEKSLVLNPYNFAAMLGKASLIQNGINSKDGLKLIDRALDIFPDYGTALFYRSLINYKNGHLLSALYYAGAAQKKNQLNNQYRKWYEFIKKNLPARNSLKRN